MPGPMVVHTVMVFQYTPLAPLQGIEARVGQVAFMRELTMLDSARLPLASWKSKAAV